jgi:hypothetical protein
MQQNHNRIGNPRTPVPLDPAMRRIVCRHLAGIDGAKRHRAGGTPVPRKPRFLSNGGLKPVFD